MAKCKVVPQRTKCCASLSFFTVDGFRRRLFSRRENTLDHYALEPVFPVADIAGIVAHADGKDGQCTLGGEVFLAGFSGQHSIEIALTISGLVVVRPLVP